MQAEQQTVVKQKKTSTGGEVKKEKKVGAKKELSTTESTIAETIPVQVTVQPTETINTKEETITSLTEENVTNFTETPSVDMDSILEFLNKSDLYAEQFKKYFKSGTLSKDDRLKFESSFKKYTKSFNAIQAAYNDYFSRQVSVLEKNSHSKSSHPKKSLEKGKAAIQKKLSVEPFLLSFMKLDSNMLVSRADALSAINAYVKKEKDAKNPEILIENDLKSFKIGGELIPLFKGIESIMRSTNKLAKDETMPTHIKYTDIMKFMTHCFIKADVTTVTSSTV
jgi:hypothetical protein